MIKQASDYDHSAEDFVAGEVTIALFRERLVNEMALLFFHLVNPYVHYLLQIQCRANKLREKRERFTS